MKNKFWRDLYKKLQDIATTFFFFFFIFDRPSFSDFAIREFRTKRNY